MKRNVRERVLKTALELFSQNGLYGVTIQELADGASTNLHGVYRSFGGKEGAFDAALDATLGEMLSPADLALLILEGRTKDNTRELIESAAMRWYESLSLRGARLMLHACLSRDRRWEKPAVDYLAEVGDVLARSMSINAEGTRGQEPFDPAIAAKTLVYSLLLFRVVEAQAQPKPEQVETVTGILRQALKGL